MLVLAFPFAGAFGSRGVLTSGGAGRFDGGLAVDGQLLRKRFVRLYSEYEQVEYLTARRSFCWC